ncbi:MAG: hypothetical protein CVU57_16295 [Deltaproteobacteria bacterium HGW-Deltaproteobacteria-15]|jgi:hypothetical protein|nr:MAG: hypothetical protein CVU57_16295 [Deltaproteobacteria bacterium HGW-Deltaproteobacteria-15]
MRITKIISGAQTGADRAALDFAIEVSIPHGGWVPKGRKAEDGIIPEKYNVQEMPTSSYPARTEKNILESHGTLIISHGKLAGGSLRTKKMAEEQKRPCLHIDLAKTNAFLAAGKIINWISAYGIEVLNVVGPRASRDPKIYQETLKVLKAFYHMATVDEEMPDPQRESPILPRTIEEALETLLGKMDMKAKTKLARMAEGELIYLHPELGAWIRDKFELSLGNVALMNSCRLAAGKKDLDADSASFLIIKKLWEKLKPNYSLRVVE